MKLFRFGVTCYVFKAHISSSFSRVWQIKFDKSRVGKEKKNVLHQVVHGLILLVQHLLQNILTSQKMNKWFICVVFTKSLNKHKRAKMLFKIHFGPTMIGQTEGKKAKGLGDIPANSSTFFFFFWHFIFPLW